MKCVVLTHTFYSDFNFGLILKACNHFTYGSIKFSKLLSQNYKTFRYVLIQPE